MAVIRTTGKNFSKDFNNKVLKQLEKKIDKDIDTFSKEGGDILKGEIQTSVAKGISPLKSGGNQTGGKARFQKYSTSYSGAIKKGQYSPYGKKTRPVNLKLSGKMMNSIKTKALQKGGFSLWFSSKLAKYHNDEGAGKSKVKRKLLPSEAGEEFSRVILNKLRDKLEKLLNR